MIDKFKVLGQAMTSELRLKGLTQLSIRFELR